MSKPRETRLWRGIELPLTHPSLLNLRCKKLWLIVKAGMVINPIPSIFSTVSSPNQAFTMSEAPTVGAVSGGASNTWKPTFRL